MGPRRTPAGAVPQVLSTVEEMFSSLLHACPERARRRPAAAQAGENCCSLDADGVCGRGVIPGFPLGPLRDDPRPLSRSLSAVLQQTDTPFFSYPWSSLVLVAKDLEQKCGVSQ